MNCLSKDEFIDYLFSEDRSIDRAGMEGHFSICAGCRAKMEALKQLKTAAASVAPDPLPGGFTARLMGKLAERDAAPQAAAVPALFTRFFRPAWGFGLAAFAVAMYAGVVFLTGHRAPRPATVEALYFSDGPATVNSAFFAPEAPSGHNGVPGGNRAGYVYPDSCETARCGIL